MKINTQLSLKDLEAPLKRFWDLSAEKVVALNSNYDEKQGSPVFTVGGQYTTRGWTEWTQGFQYGCQILIGEAQQDSALIEMGRQNTVGKMAHHVSHFGVHDHGFNNLSTYGNLLRLINEGGLQAPDEAKDFYELAIKISGSVQAKRWSEIKDGGYIYSFNGPHSLFIDTMRTCRIVVAAHCFGHRFLEENDRQINLLERALVHGMTTAKYAVYYGEGRDSYDEPGRVAHESIFNLNDGNYRCPNAQQGFSGFTTWTRGLAWAIVGYAEFLEFLSDYSGPEKNTEHVKVFEKAARATADFYLKYTAQDGIPYWDTGAPGIHQLGDYMSRTSEPINDHEPVDSSAAAIAAQGLLRLGAYFGGNADDASRYTKAGLTVLGTLLEEPYLSTSMDHQGLLLHSIYHRPNGWDHIPAGSKIPHGESSMWGDYHMTELCFLAHRMGKGSYYKFYDGLLN
ncbi:MAG: glycosyl hydrolase [Bacteroidota bacterium]